MRSMTGFGQAAISNSAFRAEVVIRSVNYRYLDVTLRLREELRDLEPELKEIVGKQLERGRVDVSIEVTALAHGASTSRVALDEEIVRELHGLSQSLVERGLIASGITFSDVLRLPQAISVGVSSVPYDDQARKAVVEATRRAAEQTEAARNTEGRALQAAILQRLDGLETVLLRLGERRAMLPEKMAADYEQKLRQWLGSNLPDPGRLAQETAMWVERTDVSEELSRLGSHLQNFRTFIAQTGQSLGKRLDFMAQEVFRELNTLGAKCRDSEMVRYVIDGKLLCEEIREQLQNVE